jgi:hypothetical protein
MQSQMTRLRNPLAQLSATRQQQICGLCTAINRHLVLTTTKRTRHGFRFIKSPILFCHQPKAQFPQQNFPSITMWLIQRISEVTKDGCKDVITDKLYSYELPSDLHTEPLDVTSSHSTTTHVSKTGMGSIQKDAPEIIGSLLSNGRFKCNEDACARKTFGRAAELRRHITTTHATDKPQFWCYVPSCARSASGNKKPFSREDKLASHIRNMHED